MDFIHMFVYYKQSLSWHKLDLISRRKVISTLIAVHIDCISEIDDRFTGALNQSTDL